MKVSREGIVLIKSFEGFRPQAVARPEGGWVIGYGHTASAREGLTVGEADAELLLQYDLMPVVKALHERVQTPLNQHQFDALASFAFSLGVERFLASDVLERINAGAPHDAADALFGWPEPAGAETALRRRAAERALFVAAPETPVTLADLLAAPLPLPASSAQPEPEPQPEPQPLSASEDARAAALAHLLGEAEPAPLAEPTPPPPTPATTTQDPQFQRYSPYQAAVIGPLPSLEPQQSVAAVSLAPLAISPASPLAVEAANDVDQTPTPAPTHIEPPTEPVFPASAAQAEAQNEAQVETQAEVQIDTAPAVADEPVTPLVIEPAAPEPLVLTPLTEAEAATEARPLWTPEQRTFGEAAAGTTNETAEALFEDGEAALGPIVRHEAEETPERGVNLAEAGAFMLMGGIGLVSFGAAMAAFRRAAMEGSAGDQTALMGWVLLVIALICVGVSAFNLYQRWGRAEVE